MKKEIKLLPFHFRGQPKGNITFHYFLVYDDNNKRYITITGPYNNFTEKDDYCGRMKKIFLALLTKSGYPLQDGKILMSYSDFLNFEFKNFPNLTIKNVLK